MYASSPGVIFSPSPITPSSSRLAEASTSPRSSYVRSSEPPSGSTEILPQIVDTVALPDELLKREDGVDEEISGPVRSADFVRKLFR